ncbi:peptidoglycan-binding domain-containing protein [Micromonospora sp. BRA006-A]|nr:peptidoglycan-binding domain-containing protein [Micromonospora sp. BRA006-A]
MPVNGVFDAATVAAVQDWQARNGVPVDVDATLTAPTWETWPRAGPEVVGRPVVAAQFMLASGLRRGHRDRRVRPRDPHGGEGPPAPARTTAQRQDQHHHVVRAGGGVVRQSFHKH